jgi:hypothetical protein
MSNEYQQEPPFAVQIEFTEGCSLYCDFCGLHGIREGVGDYKFATVETIQRIADEIKRLKWNARIEIAMRGEPSMNPNFVELISVLRKTLPKNQLMMTSNGSGYIKSGRIKAAFDAGLNILALDKYEGIDFVERALVNNEQSLIPIYNYPAEPEGNPHRRTTHNFISVMKDISIADKGTHAKLSNHCGAAFPLDYSKAGKRCARPFRELSFRYNGDVALCCNDWRGVYDCGNINFIDLENLWNGEPFQLARKALYNGQRTFKPCLGCNATSYRAGFLPDKKGKDSLPLPTKEEWIKIHGIAKQPPQTVVFLREWEKS